MTYKNYNSAIHCIQADPWISTVLTNLMRLFKEAFIRFQIQMQIPVYIQDMPLKKIS